MFCCALCLFHCGFSLSLSLSFYFLLHTPSLFVHKHLLPGVLCPVRRGRRRAAQCCRWRVLCLHERRRGEEERAAHRCQRGVLDSSAAVRAVPWTRQLQRGVAARGARGATAVVLGGAHRVVEVKVFAYILEKKVHGMNTIILF